MSKMNLMRTMLVTAVTVLSVLCCPSASIGANEDKVDAPIKKSAQQQSKSEQQLSKTLDKLVKQAQMFEAKGQCDQAIRSYSELIKLDPTNGHYLVRRGILYGSMGSYPLCVKDLTRYINSCSSRSGRDYLTAIFFRCRCFEALGDYSAAYRDVMEFARLYPCGRTNEICAKVCLAAGVYDKALKYATVGIIDNQTSPHPYVLRSINRAFHSQYELSIDDLNKAFEHQFLSRKIGPTSYQNAYSIEAMRKRFMAGSRNHLSKSGALYGAGIVDLLNEDYATPLAVFSESIKANPRFWEARNARANCYLCAGNAKAALSDAYTALKINPKSLANYSLLERCYAQTENFDDLKQVLKERTAADKSNPALLIALGHAHARLRESAEAENAYSKALQIDPKSIDALSARGHFFEDEAKYKLAIDDFTKVLEIDPSNLESYRDRASCFFQLKDYAEAIADLTKIIEMTPPSSSLLARADCFDKLGKVSLADKDRAQVRPDFGDSGVWTRVLEKLH